MIFPLAITISGRRAGGDISWPGQAPAPGAPPPLSALTCHLNHELGSEQPAYQYLEHAYMII